MTKRHRYLGQESLENSNYPQDDFEVEEEKLKRKRELFASVSKSLTSKKKSPSNSKYSYNYVEIREETLENILQEKYNCLLAWNAHYDYDLWNLVEEHFDFMWLELEHEMYLGVEYGLYEEVKNLFLELRNFFQWTSRIKERIFFSAWLKQEAEDREDIGMMGFAISSLVWSYTSSGYYQDLVKAYALWQKLAFYILPIDHRFGCDSSKNIQETLGASLYAELLMEVHENGVRIAIRQGEFDQAFIRIEKGKSAIKKLFEQKLITERLRERFHIAFTYHKGIICYLMKDHGQAEKVFGDISQMAKAIGWNRVVKGAKSWLVTLAMENKEHSKCEILFQESSAQEAKIIADKINAFPCLTKSENNNKSGHK